MQSATNAARKRDDDYENSDDDAEHADEHNDDNATVEEVSPVSGCVKVEGKAVTIELQSRTRSRRTLKWMQLA
eukprot:17987-Eustigmatos_ZCMA.PRE.1